MSNRLAGLLPAAGMTRSRAFKPLLCLGGGTMISRTADVLRSAGAEKIVVVTGYRGELLKKHLRSSDVVFVSNDGFVSTRMFDSVLLGLDALGDDFDRVLITPADVPFIRASTLCLLANSENPAAVPVYQGKRGHPVAVGKSVIPELRAYNGADGLCGALKSIGAAEISVDDEGTVISSDSPEDYFRLLERFVSRGENGERVLRLELDAGLVSEETLFSGSFARFLELIELTDSMRTACACLSISYTTGWRMLNASERALGIRLLERSSGGASGGFSALTPEGRDLLSRYQGLCSELRDFANQRFADYFSDFRLP